jgi:hypothetical protein
MTVWVHEIAGDVPESGLLRQHLQDALVVKLLDSGIRALGIGNVPEPPGNPWLNVYIAITASDDWHHFWVTVRLDEIVKPVRSHDIRTIGTTWEVGAGGFADSTTLPKKLDKELDALADYFIYDYLLENPR